MAFKSTRVNVGTTVTLIINPKNASSGNPWRVKVRNLSATTPIFVGGEDVTALNGLEVPAATTLDFILVEGDALYGVAAATQEVAVLADKQ